ncbi:hypothetical protein H072_10702 [Dactylellina haptotyla CBS 200.50]|uniref:Uncharacterized protein n=1 Tax=Dactylellina haptotyla (strain CBS 200.50) TaxID=1284197 RepID=S8A3S6_DACHA|nr:hypothetical protein H072_10702 [Dactylellina haptotyla CBS 200.50]
MAQEREYYNTSDDEGLRPRPRPRRQGSIKSSAPSGPERPRRSSAHSSVFASNELPPISPSPVSYTETQATDHQKPLGNVRIPVPTAEQPPRPRIEPPENPQPSMANENRYSMSIQSQTESKYPPSNAGEPVGRLPVTSPVESQFTRTTAGQQERVQQDRPPINKKEERRPGPRPAAGERPGTSESSSQNSLGKADVDQLIVGGRPARKLGTIEVASLIINKMIGTGIVTGPAQVLLYTGRKDYALLLWGLGFLYTLVSVVIFVEFGYKFRVTGGELVYLDESFKKPRLLFVAIFAGQFILFWNTATNCAQAARQIIACANHDINSNNVFDGLDTRLIGFIGVVISSAVCLLHYFSTAAGRLTNVGFAGFKVMMLCVLVGRGAWFAQEYQQGFDWSSQRGEVKWQAFTYAVFIVLFAFQGWENASFVAGEVDVTKTRALRNGYYLAVLTVGFLYLFVNVAFLRAFDYVIGDGNRAADMIFPQGQTPIGILADDGYAARYWGSSPGAIRAWNVLLTLSALGNVLAVTYTCGRVKQMIGQSYLFPWSRLWARESRFNTPSGGLLLHWICTSILIIIAVNIPNSGIWLPGSLQAYSHAIVALVVSAAFAKFVPPKIDGQDVYQWSWLKMKRVSGPIITLSVLMNLAMICLPIKSSVPEFSVPGWVFTATCFTAVGTSVLYYFVLFPVEDYLESTSKWKKFSLLRLVGVSWSIRFVEEEEFDERWERFQRTSRYFEDATSKVGYQDEQVKQFGERKMVYYTLDMNLIGGRAQPPSTFRKIVFWFFGGSFNNKTYQSPWTDWALKKPNMTGFQMPKFGKKNDGGMSVFGMEQGEK